VVFLKKFITIATKNIFYLWLGFFCGIMFVYKTTTNKKSVFNMSDVFNALITSDISEQIFLLLDNFMLYKNFQN